MDKWEEDISEISSESLFGFCVSYWNQRFWTFWTFKRFVCPSVWGWDWEKRSRFKWTDCRMLDLFHDTIVDLTTWRWGWAREDQGRVHEMDTIIIFSVTRNSSKISFSAECIPAPSSRMIVIIGWRSVPGIRRGRSWKWRFFCAKIGNIKTRIMDYQIKSHHTLEGMNGQESP